MAGYTPNYGAGAPGDDPPTYPTYFDYLSNTFVDHCTSLPARLKAADETPRPLDLERYYDEYDSNQSNTWARMAVEFYNQQEGNSAIILDRAKDSHKFFSEGTAYFHVNFKAGAGQHGPYYTFFAEVNGPAGIPENVTMVVQFHTKEERRTRDNCLYCTGLRHPEQGGFVGHKNNAGTGDGYEEDSDDEEEEEVEGSGESVMMTMTKMGTMKPNERKDELVIKPYQLSRVS